MRIHFLLARRVPPVPSPVLVAAGELLEQRGFTVTGHIVEESIAAVDDIDPAHDVYVLKSHTDLSLAYATMLYERGARLLNPLASCALLQNKIVASQRLAAAGVPAPRSWVTGDVDHIANLAAEHPVVVKPVNGHRGRGVHIVRHPNEVAGLDLAGPVIVQELVQGDGEDLKVYCVGEQVFAVRKPFSSESFAVPGRPVPVSAEVRAMAVATGRAFGLGLYGLDVIEGPDGPRVVDVNTFPGYKGVPDIAPVIAAYIDDFACGRVRLALPTLDEVPSLVDAEVAA